MRNLTYENFDVMRAEPPVHEKLVSHKLSSFCEKHVFLPAAQFAYRKGLGCTDELLNIYKSPSEVPRYKDGVLYYSARL